MTADGPARPSVPDGLVDALRTVVGRHLIDDPDVIASSTTDWTGRFVGHAPLLVRPGSTEEVARVVGLCRRAGVALVPQGGRTGLVGGSVPLLGEIVLDLGRLDGIGPVDGQAGQVTAGAGVTLESVQRHAAEAGWSYGVDLASRGSATVGGMVATNAGGVRVLRYGDTRAQLIGIEAVLGTGAVVSHLAGLVKDNTGYHLPGLLCGSEGTLGVVTAARLRLVPAVASRTVALLAFGSVTDAVEGAARLRRSLASLDACELFLAPGLDLVCEVTGARQPFARRWPAYLLVEAADRRDPTDELVEAVQHEARPVDSLVATEPSRRAELWWYREAHTEVINTLGPPHKLDVTVPVRHLVRLIENVPLVAAAVEPGARTWLFGHVGDGNVHVNVTGLDPDDDRVDDAVLRLVAGLDGSISAEHGIGVAKKRWLTLSRSQDEIRTFRDLKRALDPDGVLNPNVLLPPEGSGAGS